MPRFMKVLLGLNAVLLAGNLLAGLTHAQRPPDSGADGVQFLKVNINPTNVPPMVNINPNQTVPRVEVSQMPDVKIAATGCQTRGNFHTAAGRTISGPLMVTYLNLPPKVSGTLADARGSETLDLGGSSHLATAIFLQAGQRLEFDSSVLYSGCRPD
jgi:hypothetical protein